MKKEFLPTSALIFLALFAVAQNNKGARITAMGNTSAALFDIWSITSNPAGITREKTATAAVNYTKFLFGDELSEQSVAFVAPVKDNFFGLSVNRYGISEFNEIKAGVVIAKQFGGELSIGLKANYHQVKITNYGNSNAFSIDVGANYLLNKEINLGLYVNNPSSQKYTSTLIEADIPVAAHFGATYQPSNKVILATTITKYLDRKFDVGIGIDYNFYDFLSLRGGLTAKPFQQYFGLGVNYQKFKLDLATSSHPQIGFTPQIGLSYAF
jgi:hypothetical protein